MENYVVCPLASPEVELNDHKGNKMHYSGVNGDSVTAAKTMAFNISCSYIK